MKAKNRIRNRHTVKREDHPRKLGQAGTFVVTQAGTTTIFYDMFVVAVRWLLVPICCAVTAVGATSGVETVRFAGKPAEIGAAWGRINAEHIRHDLQEHYLKKARDLKIASATLVVRAGVFERIAGEVAPHWLEEARAVAGAAGVDEALYISFVANVYRDLFAHDECTSYAVSREYTEDRAILFHKNRDNVAKDQSAFILDSAVSGVNKFIAVSDASVIGCMMMVNEKGLAGSADTPGGPESLQPTKADPSYRGLMNVFVLRHIAERAANCEEALAIIRDFVKKGYYAGGRINGTHWLFVDAKGTILEVSNNSQHVASRIHRDKVYFSIRGNTSAARRLRETKTPVSFNLFHSVSRDPSICLDKSIAGMTVEIAPDDPALFTTAWISLPAHAASFPLFMGGQETPLSLVNGEAYRLARTVQGRNPEWEAMESNAHREAVGLRKELATLPSSDRATNAARRLDTWIAQRAGAIVAALRTDNAKDSQ